MVMLLLMLLIAMPLLQSYDVDNKWGEHALGRVYDDIIGCAPAMPGVNTPELPPECIDDAQVRTNRQAAHMQHSTGQGQHPCHALCMSSRSELRCMTAEVSLFVLETTGKPLGNIQCVELGAVLEPAGDCVASIASIVGVSALWAQPSQPSSSAPLITKVSRHTFDAFLSFLG